MRSRPKRSCSRTKRPFSSTTRPSPRADAVEVAINALYDAASDAGLLEKAIEQVTLCLGGYRGILLQRPGAFSATPRFAQVHNFEAEIVDLVNREHYWDQDPWSHAADTLAVTAGQTLLGEQLVDDATLKSTEFFTDLLEPFDISRILVGVADRKPDEILHLTVFGGERRGPFGNEHRRAMSALLPAIRVATRSVLQLQRYSARAAALEKVLERIPEAIFLVDLRGRVRSANTAAEELLTGCHGLTVSQRFLVARRPQETDGIRKMLRDAATPGAASGSVIIHDELGRATFLLRALPLRSAQEVRDDANCYDVPVAAVFICGTAALRPPPEDVLAAFFGLTPSEARVAVKLAEGFSQQEIVERFGITRNTLKGHLKAIFQKTGAHRQTDLAKLVLSLGLGPRS